MQVAKIQPSQEAYVPHSLGNPSTHTSWLALGRRWVKEGSHLEFGVTSLLASPTEPKT